MCCFFRPTPVILWFADTDFLLEPSAYYTFGDNNRSLTINSVLPGDERHYGCQATNTEGTTEPVYQQVLVAGQRWRLCDH